MHEIYNYTVAMTTLCTYIGTYWYSHWPSGGSCAKQKYASLLYVWTHCEQGQ